MKFFFILVILMIILWFWAGRFAFRKACGRGAGLDLNDRERIRGTAWERYYDSIMEGIRWIEAQPYEEVSITSRDGLKLYGNLIRHPQAKGTILMFHGYRTFAKCDFSADSDHYYNLGYNLLQVDQRACGRSEGNYITFGVRESEDCHQWMAYIQDRFGEDHRMYLAGLSLGASTVLMALKELVPETLCGVIADSAFTTPKEIISNTIKHTYHVPSGWLMPVIGFWARVQGHFSLTEVSTIEVLKQSRTRVFLVHGKSDTYVPWQMSVENYNACASEKELYLAEGADHGTSYMVDPVTYRRKLTEFIR